MVSSYASRSAINKDKLSFFSKTQIVTVETLIEYLCLIGKGFLIQKNIMGLHYINVIGSISLELMYLLR